MSGVAHPYQASLPHWVANKENVTKFAEPNVILAKEKTWTKQLLPYRFHFRHMLLMFSLVASAPFGAKGANILSFCISAS